MNNAYRPAMPYVKGEHDCEMNTRDTRGLTKREYFASMAMQGILASSADRGETAVAQMSLKFADELLKHLGE